MAMSFSSSSIADHGSTGTSHQTPAAGTAVVLGPAGGNSPRPIAVDQPAGGDSPQQASSSTFSPQKMQMEMQIQRLQEALRTTRFQAESQAFDYVENREQGLRRAAEEYKQTVGDVAQAEVAQAEARAHSDTTCAVIRARQQAEEVVEENRKKS